MSLALASSLANAKQASSVLLGEPDRPLLDDFEARSHLVRWYRRHPHARCLHYGVHELTVSRTCLLNISLRKLAELLRDLEGLVLGHEILPACIICNAGSFDEATRSGRPKPHDGQRRRRLS